jgi:hypothetical protein
MQSDLQIHCNPHQNNNYFLHRNGKKKVLKIVRNNKRPKIANTIFGKKNKAGGIATPDLETYYKAIVIKPFL